MNIDTDTQAHREERVKDREKAKPGAGRTGGLRDQDTVPTIQEQQLEKPQQTCGKTEEEIHVFGSHSTQMTEQCGIVTWNSGLTDKKQMRTNRLLPLSSCLHVLLFD